MSRAARFARLTLVSAGLAFIALGGGIQAATARQVEPASAGRVVSFAADFPPGTIVISQRERRLYLTLGDGRAIRYPVAVGKSGKAWSGWATASTSTQPGRRRQW